MLGSPDKIPNEAAPRCTLYSVAVHLVDLGLPPHSAEVTEVLPASQHLAVSCITLACLAGTCPWHCPLADSIITLPYVSCSARTRGKNTLIRISRHTIWAIVRGKMHLRAAQLISPSSKTARAGSLAALYKFNLLVQRRWTRSTNGPAHAGRREQRRASPQAERLEDLASL